MQNVTVDRYKYIGGSDVPVIMGISSFKTRFELLLEKAQLREDNFEGNSYTEYGNIMEPKIRNYINESFGKNFVEGKHIEDDIRCHTDGEDYDTILEIKTTSQVYDTIDEYKTYLVQLLFYMYHTKKYKGMLAVYYRPTDFNEEFDWHRLQIFSINIDNYKELVEKINAEVDKFRADLEKVKVNPFITEEELQPLDLVEVSNRIVLLEERLKTYKEIEAEQKELKAKLKAMMEENGVKKWTTNNGVQITLVEDSKDTEVQVFNGDKFREENEELYQKYLETVIKKGRAGSIRITFPKNEGTK